jgi:cytochrome c oxidase cbb3-type subunit IV
MFKHYFEQIAGVAIYPLISFGIFFLFFIGLLLWVIFANKNYIQTMRNKPLEDGSTLSHFDYNETT